jgi:hypothetical protein
MEAEISALTPATAAGIAMSELMKRRKVIRSVREKNPQEQRAGRV